MCIFLGTSSGAADLASENTQAAGGEEVARKKKKKNKRKIDNWQLH